MFLFENVPGMLGEKHMPYTRHVFGELERAGYRVELKLLDAVNYGVPQHRKRVWWWGIRDDVGAEHAWPAPTHAWPWPESSMFGCELARAVTVGWALGIPHMQRDGVWFEGDGEVRVCMGGGTHPRVHEYRWSDEMLAKHPPASPASPSPPVMAKWYKGGAKGVVEVREKRVRRLTPLEVARLQSCPDDMVWPEGVGKTAMYKVIGNGVACEMANHLSRAMKASDPASTTLVSLFCGGGLMDLGFHGRYWSWKGEKQ
jgi:DNA (cytosine-5)-methyltransferase 1